MLHWYHCFRLFPLQKEYLLLAISRWNANGLLSSSSSSTPIKMRYITMTSVFCTQLLCLLLCINIFSNNTTPLYILLYCFSTFSFHTVIGIFLSSLLNAQKKAVRLFCSSLSYLQFSDLKNPPLYYVLLLFYLFLAVVVILFFVAVLQPKSPIPMQNINNIESIILFIKTPLSKFI